MKIIAIIQARMGSTRLPGKVLLNIHGEPMLARVIGRLSRASRVDEVCIATTTEAEDQSIVELCVARGWKYSRGSRDDVLDRYYQSALATGAEVVVRITSDCPLIDGEVIDRIIEEFQRDPGGIDYASNTSPIRTFPRGLDAEVFTFAVLERVWQEDADAASREHVTPYIYRNPDRFRIRCVTASADFSSHRWTVDTPEDLELVRRIYQAFTHDRFSWREVVTMCEAHPEWQDINRHVLQKAH